MMNFSLWFSLGLFLLVAGICLEVALGWRKIAHLGDQPDRLDRSAGIAEPPPKVSIIVAALNEAATIEPALRSLLSIDYPNLEVIAINDRSTDATPRIMDGIASENAALRVVHITELPPGWLGKNHALHRGASMASGEYLLFTDADAVFDPTAVTRAVAYCRTHRIDHLALFFDVVARTQLLRLMILSFAAGFMARYKPWKVDASANHFVGVGGFNMVRAAAYADAGGHAAMPLAVLDDMALGRLIKLKGYRQRALFGTGMVTIEWYRSTPELIRGMEKNIFSAFDYRVGPLVAASLLIMATRVWPWAGLFLTQGMSWWFNAAAVCAGLALHIDLLRARGWDYRCLAFAPAVPLVELAMWWRGALLTLARGGIVWRGTQYPLAQLRQAHAMNAPQGSPGSQERTG